MNIYKYYITWIFTNIILHAGPAWHSPCPWTEWLIPMCDMTHSYVASTLRRRKGPAVPERDLQNMDGEKIDWRYSLYRQSVSSLYRQWNHDDAHDELFRIFPSGKTGARRREHRVYWFAPSVYCFLICDGRNCELLNCMMTQICSRNRPHRVVKWRMSSYELNPLKQKGVNLEGLGGWRFHGPPGSVSLRGVSIQKPASRISQLSRRENGSIFFNSIL